MPPTAQNPSSRRWRLIAIGAILIIAALLRAPALDRVPPGFWSDEALNGQDAWAVWQPGGHFKIVYSDLFPREPFYETLLAFVVKAAGPSVVAMRSLSVAIGIFTVLLLYLFLRGEAGERAALCSAAVLATMRWHVIFSRLIFRTLVLPAWICGLVWAALSWRRRPTLWRAVLFGALLGGGFYTYLAWYFMLPLAGVLVVWAAAAEVQSRNGRIRLAAALGIAALVAAPILYHYMAYPKDLFDRPGAVSPFSNGMASGMAEIGQNLGEALVMCFWFGDHVPLQNIPGKAALDAVQMVFFAWGLVLCLVTIRRRVLAPILILWLMCGIAPTVFTLTDSPNFLRSLVATPAVAALTGIGLADIAGMVARRKPAAAVTLACLAIAVSSGLTARDIYLVWPHREDVWGRFHGPAVQVADFANEASADAAVFVPEPFTEGRPYQFITLAAARPENIYPFSNALPLGPWPPVPQAAGRPAPARRIVIVPNDERILRALGPNTRTLKTFSTPTGKIWGVAVSMPGR
ncbi:glycosyltransferase family 39 protein [bacterium]|nr:glycosyltransferase family 39 protein [bacterium]